MESVQERVATLHDFDGAAPKAPIDAAFNGLEYDRAGEREQFDAYAGAIGPPGADERLPAWAETTLSAREMRAAAREALAGATG
jgi:glucosyl-3-phosphoglycerate synthase